MSGSATHQTISYLAQRFSDAGVRLHARHGQNFLIDLNLQRLIVERAQLAPNDVVLEVGTGTGALAALVAPQVAAVVTVEIDPQLRQLAAEELFGFENVVILNHDALKNKSHFDPRVLAEIERQLAISPDRRLKLVANLPYCVATPVIANLLALDRPPDSMTVTIQKELADRITAAPATKDYGALSVWIQSQCRVELVRVLPPSVFWPKPKVTSAILRIDVERSLRARIADLAFFHDFVRSLFFHRRKLLRGVLHSALKDRFDKLQIDRILEENNLLPTCRAEELGIATILALCNSFASR